MELKPALDASNTHEPFEASDFDGISMHPSGEILALLFRDASKPEMLLPVFIDRPAAQKLVESVQIWLATTATATGRPH